MFSPNGHMVMKVACAQAQRPLIARRGPRSNIYISGGQRLVAKVNEDILKLKLFSIQKVD